MKNEELMIAMHESKKIIASVLGFFQNALLDPNQTYHLYPDEKLLKFMEVLNRRMQAIPPEKLVRPSVNILGPILEALKYSLDEKYVKEMLLRLLLADIHIDKKPRVLPAFVDVIKQLSREDAKFLAEDRDQQVLYRVIWLSSDALPISPNRDEEIYKVYTSELYSYDSALRKVKKQTHVKILSEAMFDNLERLKLVYVADAPDDLPDEVSAEELRHRLQNCGMLQYEGVIAHIKEHRAGGLETRGLLNAQGRIADLGKGDAIPFSYIEIRRAVIAWTPFGKRFRDLCVGEG
ncbi:MAG: DUF4393 domain-containing protein [Oscillospiraceae bacterium]|nr:DUF4393 domain-containing protein [Oscillospiraceae bacterium]